MNTIPPSGRPTPLRRWFLFLLTTHPARHLLHDTFATASAVTCRRDKVTG